MIKAFSDSFKQYFHPTSLQYNSSKRQLSANNISVKILNKNCGIFSEDNFKRYFDFQDLMLAMKIELLDRASFLEIKMQLSLENKVKQSLDTDTVQREILRMNNGINNSDIKPLIYAFAKYDEGTKLIKIDVSSKVTIDHLKRKKIMINPENGEKIQKMSNEKTIDRRSMQQIREKIAQILLKKYLALVTKGNYLEELCDNIVKKNHRGHLQHFIQFNVRSTPEQKMYSYRFPQKQEEMDRSFQIVLEKTKKNPCRKYYKDIDFDQKHPIEVNAVVSKYIEVYEWKAIPVTVALTKNSGTDAFINTDPNTDTKTEEKKKFDIFTKEVKKSTESKDEKKIRKQKLYETFVKREIEIRKITEKAQNISTIFIPKGDQNKDKVVTKKEGQNLQIAFDTIKIKSSLIILQVRILFQIIRGLRSIHEQQIVHRDIRAPNIVLDLKKNIKIIDFGLAITMYNTGNRFIEDQGVRQAIRSIFSKESIPERLFGMYERSPKYDIWKLIKTLQNIPWKKIFFQINDYSLIIQGILRLMAVNEKIEDTMTSQEIEEKAVLFLKQIKYLEECSQAAIS